MLGNLDEDVMLLRLSRINPSMSRRPISATSGQLIYVVKLVGNGLDSSRSSLKMFGLTDPRDKTIRVRSLRSPRELKVIALHIHELTMILGMRIIQVLHLLLTTYKARRPKPTH